MDDYDIGRAGYPPRSGASIRHHDGYQEYLKPAPPTAGASEFAGGTMVGTSDCLVFFVFFEALGLALPILLGGPSGTVARLVAGSAVGVAYFFLNTRLMAIYWMLIPRMLAWGWLVGSITGGWDSEDLVWPAFWGLVAAGIVCWNAILTKRAAK